MAKIGVIGAGYWGPNLIRNLHANDRCTELVVCDRDPKRLAGIKKRFPAIETEADANTLFESDLDGVVIATPVGTHFPLGEAALNAGKHVFVEKPLAANVEHAQALVKLAEQNKKTLMVGHTFEYSAPVRKIRELVRSGELGKIFFVSSMRVNLGLHQKDVSVIWDLAPHDFSILFSWLDERPSSVSAMGSACVQKGLPDVAFLNLQFPSGTVASLEVSWLAPSKLRRTTIVGDKKMVVYDDTSAMEKVKVYDRGVDFKNPETFGEFQLSYRTGDIWIPKLESTEPLALEMDEFLRAIDEGSKPQSDGLSGLRVVEALAASQKSLEQGGTPVVLNR